MQTLTANSLVFLFHIMKLRITWHTPLTSTIYEYKHRSRIIDCIPIPQIWIKSSKSQNLNPKSNITHIPQIQIPLYESSKIPFLNPQSEHHSYPTNLNPIIALQGFNYWIRIESRSRFRCGIDYRIIRTPLNNCNRTNNCL